MQISSALPHSFEGAQLNILLQNAQKLIEDNLHKLSKTIEQSFSGDEFTGGSVGAWHNQNGTLNAHFVLFRVNNDDPIECIIHLSLTPGKAEVCADVCQQDGTILYSVGDFEFGYYEEKELLAWLDSVCQSANEGFLRYFSDLRLESK